MSEQFPTGGLVKVYIRHAESENNARAASGDPRKDRVGGYQPRVELSATGRKQVPLLGGIMLSALAERLGGDDFKIVRFSAAPARRTWDTAELVHDAMGVDVPLLVRPDLRELCKGNKWLGGDEKRLRSKVETPDFHARRAQAGWDFRYGRAFLGRIGLGELSGAETAREAGARIAAWYEEMPPMSDEDRTSGRPIVDITVAHGLAGRGGLATLLHRDPQNPDAITITVEEADRRYNMANASAHILLSMAPGEWTMLEPILLPNNLPGNGAPKL